MNQKQRQLAYMALAVLNAVLVGLEHQNLVPTTWQQVAALVSLLLAMGMKAFGDKDPQEQKQ